MLREFGAEADGFEQGRDGERRGFARVFKKGIHDVGGLLIGGGEIFGEGEVVTGFLSKRFEVFERGKNSLLAGRARAGDVAQRFVDVEEDGSGKGADTLVAGFGRGALRLGAAAFGECFLSALLGEKALLVGLPLGEDRELALRLGGLALVFRNGAGRLCGAALIVSDAGLLKRS